MVIAQLWAFANDLYTCQAGRTAVPAGRAGQFAGRVAGRDGGHEDDPRDRPLWADDAAALLLRCCAALTWWIDRSHVAIRPRGSEYSRTAAGQGGRLSIDLPRPLSVVDRRVGGALEYREYFGRVPSGQARGGRSRPAFPDGVDDGRARQRFHWRIYGSFFAWVNMAGLLLQASSCHAFSKRSVPAARCSSVRALLSSAIP